MLPPEIDYLGEGLSDLAVARKLIVTAGGVPATSYHRPLSGTGKQNVDRRLKGLNAGAEYGRPVLVLRDLDNDARCPAELVHLLLPSRHQRLLLRVCVREVEAWLMADQAAYADYLGMQRARIPSQLELLQNPKAKVLRWAADGHAKRLTKHIADARRRGVPDWASLGEWHATFAETRWDPNRAVASGTAESLRRAIQRLRELVRAQTRV